MWLDYNSYTNDTCDNLIIKLPLNSIIIIFTNNLVDKEFKNNSKFLILDDAVTFAFFEEHNTNGKPKDSLIRKGYLELFKYIEHNFNTINTSICKNHLYEIIKNISK